MFVIKITKHGVYFKDEILKTNPLGTQLVFADTIDDAKQFDTFTEAENMVEKLGSYHCGYCVIEEIGE